LGNWNLNRNVGDVPFPMACRGRLWWQLVDVTVAGVAGDWDARLRLRLRVIIVIMACAA